MFYFTESAVADIFLTWRWGVFTLRSLSASMSRQKSPVVIAMTSYPARFRFLKKTLKCLVTQSTPPSHIVVYVAEADFPELEALNLPDKFARFGVTFKSSAGPDARSYKRIAALTDFPSSLVVFVDDDLYIRSSLVEDLLVAHAGAPNAIVSHRANRIVWQSEGVPRPFQEWPDATAEDIDSANLVPCTGAGTLYPPGIIGYPNIDYGRVSRLAPTADDLWLYFAQRRFSAKILITGGNHSRLINWFGSQAGGLWHANLTGGGNDTQFRALLQNFQTNLGDKEERQW